MKNNIFLKVLLVIIVFVILAYNPSSNKVPAEQISIPSAVGIDIEKINSNLLYKISVSSYIFQELQQSKKSVTVGEGFSPLQSRQLRVLKINKNFEIGLEKVDVISEETARMGINGSIDMFFNIPKVNDTALMAVCEGKARDILDFNTIGYPSSGDYLEQMINSLKAYNFFSDNYKIIDVFTRVDSEGRNITLPYIRITKDGLTVDGLAIFRKDKMIEKVGMEDARILNMLSEGAGKGIITIQKSSDSYADYYSKVNRKVTCTKKNGKYIFDINLKFKGDLTANQYNKDTQNKLKEKEKLEKELENKIDNKSKEFIKKMQKVYKVDCLELGRIAAAKYGRDTGIDWDEVISNSEINVKSSVEIAKQGRGEY